MSGKIATRGRLSLPAAGDGRAVCELYALGLTIGGDPSPIGGVWGFSHVAGDGSLLAQETRIVTPAEFGVAEITGDLVELLAVINAAAMLPHRWRGIIYADVLRPRRGFLKATSFAGVDDDNRHAFRFLREGLGIVDAVPLGAERPGRGHARTIKALCVELEKRAVLAAGI